MKYGKSAYITSRQDGNDVRLLEAGSEHDFPLEPVRAQSCCQLRRQDLDHDHSVITTIR